jgi:hypothetical protein
MLDASQEIRHVENLLYRLAATPSTPVTVACWDALAAITRLCELVLGDDVTHQP